MLYPEPLKKVYRMSWKVKLLNPFSPKPILVIQNKHDTPPTRNQDDDGGYFESIPFRVFRGSEGPIIDLNWSKKMYFLLSAGTDRNVRLWHIARVSWNIRSVLCLNCICSFLFLDISVLCRKILCFDDSKTKREEIGTMSTENFRR